MNDIRLVAFNGHEMILSIVLAAGKVDLEAQDLQEKTALIWAVEEYHEKIVELLLDKGAEVNAQGRNFGNALQVVS